jgi:hypothetical protein
MARDLPRREQYLAFGALDKGGEAYVVFDPIDAFADVRRRAVRLGPAITLDHAQTMAADFNEGAGWPFRVKLGHLLIGQEIPHLRKE